MYTNLPVFAVDTSGTNDLLATDTNRTMFLSKEPESFTYEADALLRSESYGGQGALIADGRWVYEWNGKNRLIHMTTHTNLPTSVPRVKLEFANDHCGRRVHKAVIDADGQDAWTQRSEPCFSTYDGGNLTKHTLVEVTTPTRDLGWGFDLSSGLQDAGGVGELLDSWNDIPFSTGGNKKEKPLKKKMLQCTG